MATNCFNKRPISLALQKLSIEHTYSNVKSCKIRNNVLTCILYVTPSDVSDTYTVKIEYHFKYKPSAVLIAPELQLFNGKRPTHLYGNDNNGNPKLCVFCPMRIEWNSQMYLSKSFIPWISTWLNTYEYWVITGEWHYPESSHAVKKV